MSVFEVTADSAELRQCCTVLRSDCESKKLLFPVVVVVVVVVGGGGGGGGGGDDDDDFI